MSRISDLLNKGSKDKATGVEIDMAVEMTGEKYPDFLNKVQSDPKALCALVYILNKRENPLCTLEKVSETITAENYIELAYEVLYAFTAMSRSAIEKLKTSGTEEKNSPPASN